MTSTAPSGVAAAGLGKRFGDAWVLRDVDLTVPPGTVLGLLGPNGAGKTTTVRILTTLLTPDEGSATVAGHDVVTAPDRVRTRLGLTSQQATIDPLLTGRANLELFTRLYHLPRAVARARAQELLERFDLVDAGDRLARTYSGGMSRRLDLAASLVAAPPVLFLDEPTTGLDPRSRNTLLDLVRELAREGTAVVLTTQYLEEADRLADEIVVLDGGRIIAAGTPATLKERVGGSRLTVVVDDAGETAGAAAALAPFTHEAPSVDGLEVSVAASADVGVIDVVRALDQAGVRARDVRVRQASLDDVFLALTGHAAAEPTPAEEAVPA